MSVHSVIRGVMSGWYIETGDSGEPYATAESASERIIRALDTAGLLVIRGGEPEPPALPADLPQEPRNAAPWPAADLSKRELPQPAHPLWGPPAPGTHESDYWRTIRCPFNESLGDYSATKEHDAEYEVACAWSRAHATKEGQ